MDPIEQVAQWFADNRTVLESRLAAYDDDLDRALAMIDTVKHPPWWDLATRVYRWRLGKALVFIGTEARDARTRIDTYRKLQERLARGQINQAIALLESIAKEQRVGRWQAFRALFSLMGETVLRHSREATVRRELLELRAALLTQKNVTV